jgi:hypothetical protein
MAELSVLSCRLDATGQRRQAERYRRLSASVEAVGRAGDTLEITFDADVDLPLLRKTVGVERACCPFFDLRLDEPARALHVAVADAGHRPALGALAAAIQPQGGPDG